MPRRPEPQVIRQEVHWVPLPESRRVYMGHGDHPYRIWTLYMHADPAVKPELPITPVHNHGAFLEDYVHDWNFVFDKGRKEFFVNYGSRVADRGVWILVEFTDEASNPFGKRPR